MHLASTNQICKAQQYFVDSNQKNSVQRNYKPCTRRFSRIIHLSMLRYISCMEDQKTKHTRSNQPHQKTRTICIISKITRGHSAAPKIEMNDIKKKLHYIQTFLADKKKRCNQANLTKHINYSPPTETLRSYCGSNICHMTRIGEVATRSLRAHGFYQRLSYKANSSGIQCSFQQAYTGKSHVGSTAEHTHASPSTYDPQSNNFGLR